MTLLFCANYCLAQEPAWLVPPGDSFNSIGRFSEGLAHVDFRDSRSVSFIDTSGRVKSWKEPFDDAGNFHNGLAWVYKKINGKTLYGFINKAGELVIPYQYDEVEDFSCNRAAVQQDGIWKYINREGKTVIGDDWVITEMPVINLQQEQEMEDVEPPAFACGRVLYRDENGHYGYRDTLGQFVIPARVDYACDFTDGVAAVADTIPAPVMEDDDTLSRLYNRLPPGPPQYRYRLIDLDGKTICRPDSNVTLDLNGNFSNGLISFLLETADSSNWGIMNTHGQVVVAPKYRNKPLPFCDGVSVVQVDGDKSKWNKDGYLITLDTLGRTIARFSLETPYGILYDSNLGFHEGLIAVKIGDLWGYINAKGRVVIRPQFQSAGDFHEGFAVVMTPQGKAGVIRNPLNIHH
ncbi:hypothetical protein A8C56_20995 [Niabella ginsenosidivorans]|uniref:WG repeat-containing protein n=1 Tax=Niabella ginsenosidivorans TaxID=1176587 RepID=A0A1A9I688_9BACT|nr:hypothetical protein A8C56_20995 [Niabella ginsenosidivorans]